MISEFWVWLILLLPLGSFALIGLLIRPFLARRSELAGQVTVGSVGAAFLLSLWALVSTIADGATAESWTSYTWLSVGNLEIDVGILLDPLTALMLVVVTGVSLLVQIYSTGYMKGDPSYARYFAFMSLFTGSMVGLVIASNIVQLYFFWELVGLCSFLLIGFWHERPAAAAAAKKAFIITRLGDFGFLLAILYLFLNADSIPGNALDIRVLTNQLPLAIGAGTVAASVATWVGLGIFAGAVGKSGQFPLHTWLPDAMEGPTPVSALIHAATMVAAGVFLVARFFDLFASSETVMTTVTLIGGFTALFAATMGLVNNDIKRVLAYSTVSQLGYMMFALGVGAYGAAVFHLFTHAFFKALLFLGAGSVSHATGTFDMRYMGGLRKVMPRTYRTFLVGALSLCGIFPLAGFWSKDEILAHGLSAEGIGQIAVWLPIVAVALTILYTVRAITMTFEGEFRGGADADKDAHSHGAVHLAESPQVMVVPLVVLAVATVLGGWLINPTIDLGVVEKHWLAHFLVTKGEELNLVFAVGSTVFSVALFLAAYRLFSNGTASSWQLSERLRPAHLLLSRKYYLDHLYEDIITVRAFYGGAAWSLDWADKNVVDGVVRRMDWFGTNIGRAIALVQTGQLQGYGVAISVGVLAIVGIYLIL